MPLCSELMQFLLVPPNKEITPDILSLETFYKFSIPYKMTMLRPLPPLDWQFCTSLTDQESQCERNFTPAATWRDL